MENLVQLFQKEQKTLAALVSLNAPKGTDVETIVMQELEYLQHLAFLNPVIAQCTPQSIVFAVKKAMRNNLTLDPSAGLVYIKTRDVYIKTPGQADQKVKVLETQETANGLISVNRQCGSLYEIDGPFVDKDDTGRVIGVWMKILIPSVNEELKPIAKWVEKRFDTSHFMRWRVASHRENSRWKKDGVDDKTLNQANASYTNWYGGIDPEFARAKCIRHGLKKLGTNQNEVIMTSISKHQPKKIILDDSADRAAAGEEQATAPVDTSVSQAKEQQYTSFEEVKPEGPLKVNLPDASQL